MKFTVMLEPDPPCQPNTLAAGMDGVPSGTATSIMKRPLDVEMSPTSAKVYPPGRLGIPEEYQNSFIIAEEPEIPSHPNVGS
jgi:hypothetical protein